MDVNANDVTTVITAIVTAVLAVIVFIRKTKGGKQ